MHNYIETHSHPVRLSPTEIIACKCRRMLGIETHHFTMSHEMMEPGSALSWYKIIRWDWSFLTRTSLVVLERLTQHLASLHGTKIGQLDTVLLPWPSRKISHRICERVSPLSSSTPEVLTRIRQVSVSSYQLKENKGDGGHAKYHYKIPHVGSSVKQMIHFSSTEMLSVGKDTGDL